MNVKAAACDAEGEKGDESQRMHHSGGRGGLVTPSKEGRDHYQL